MSSETVETVYGRMPAHLSCAKLQDLCVDAGIQTGPFGSQLHQEDYVPKGTPIITVEHLGENRISHSNLPLVSDEDKARLSKYVLRTGDIVFSRVGSVDRRALVQPTEDGWLFSGRCLRVRVDTTLLDARWLSYFFGLPSFKNYIRGIAVGATMPSINTKILSDIPIYFPDLATQREAALTLAQIDDRITLLRETNKTLEAIAQALFKSWFVDFDPVRAKMEGRQPEGMDEATAALFPDSFEESELGLVPRGWKVLPFLEVCEMQGGAQPPASEFKDESREGYIRLLQIRDFSTDAHKTYVPLEKKLKTATDDDVLIGRYGSASGDKEKDSLGRVCRGLAGAYNVALMKLVPLLVGREFAMQLVDDPRFYQYLQGVSSKAVQSGFSKKELAHYKVAVPSVNLCEKYETFGALIWRRSKEIKEQIENLSNLRDILLPRLISGQLRLSDAEAKIGAHTA